MTDARDGALYRSLASALAAVESGRLDNAERSLVRARRDVAATLGGLPRHSRRRRKAEQAVSSVSAALDAALAKDRKSARTAARARSELGRLLAENAAI